MFLGVVVGTFVCGASVWVGTITAVRGVCECVCVGCYVCDVNKGRGHRVCPCVSLWGAWANLFVHSFVLLGSECGEDSFHLLGGVWSGGFGW
jgi:hypothetical protein